MKSFVARLFEGKEDESVHQQFIRFGKGTYGRRFLLSVTKGSMIKIRGSFEWANDFVNFVRENKNVTYSGKVLMREKVAGQDGKKKAGSFVYEINESSIDAFEHAFFYLLDAHSEGIVLKIKKNLPKPGKDEGKIDDKFCSLDLDPIYWDAVKDAFFWDVPECKKTIIEHELRITQIDIPSNVKDPAEMRRLARRKGVIVRKIVADGKELVSERTFSA